MENEVSDLSSDEIKRMAGVINKSGKRLHKRIEKFLLYSELLSLSRGELLNVKDTEIKFELDSELLMRELNTSFKEYDRVNDVKISFEDCDLRIQERFYKIILNELIENSTKFSEKGTKITVEGFVDGDYYKTKVMDNGFGMDNKSVKEIDSFKQFSNEIYQREGIGIGLALVKQTIKIFDGFITIDSKKNQYAQVEFGIPLAKIEVEK
jgi:signal transduction histidine kinase